MTKAHLMALEVHATLIDWGDEVYTKESGESDDFLFIDFLLFLTF